MYLHNQVWLKIEVYGKAEMEWMDVGKDDWHVVIRVMEYCMIYGISCRSCTTRLYDVDIFGVSFIHSNSFLGKTLFAYFFINGYQVEDDPGLTMGHTPPWTPQTCWIHGCNSLYPLITGLILARYTSDSTSSIYLYLYIYIYIQIYK